MQFKAALITSGLLALSGWGGSGEENNPPAITSPPPSPPAPTNPTTPDFTTPLTDSSEFIDIGVHDPSIVKVDDTYYVFGSHLAAAKSCDLMHWEYISTLSANHLVDESPLFNSYTSEFAEGIAWTIILPAAGLPTLSGLLRGISGFITTTVHKTIPKRPSEMKYAGVVPILV